MRPHGVIKIDKMASAWQTFRVFKMFFSFVLDQDSPYGAQNEK